MRIRTETSWSLNSPFFELTYRLDKKSMSTMMEIRLNQLNDIQIKELPSSWGTIAFYESSACLYLLLCPNLKRKIVLLKDQLESEGTFHELVTQTDIIQIHPAEDSIAALLAYKRGCLELMPQQQQRHFAQKDYVYLALNAWNYPFVTSQDYTLEDWNYLGPFRDRFLLAEYVDSISRILQLPYCETGSFPCEKFDQHTCKGWCLALNPSEELGKQDRLKKLENLLFESYMVPGDTVIKLLETEYNKYFENLEFEKAELFSEQISLHQRYQNWLRFLVSAKHLSYEADRVVIQDGQMIRAFDGDSWLDLPTLKLEYRTNEILALDKSVVDEAKIIYDYINLKLKHTH